MKGIAVAMVDGVLDGSELGASGERTSERLLDCGCDVEIIQAFHGYLSEQFPGYVLRHFHAPSRVLQPGLQPLPAVHHGISITRADILPYYVVLMDDFEEWSVQQVWEHLRQVDLAGTARGYRIAVVSKEGASGL